MSFWESILLIIIPIISGALSTYFLSHSWQNYKYKISLKQELLYSFNNSINRIRSLETSIIVNIIEYYSAGQDFENILDKGEFIISVSFPSEKDKQPKNIFLKEYDELIRHYSDYKINAKLFKSKLRLYTLDDELLTQFKKIENNLLFFRVMIRKTVYSELKPEFIDNYMSCHKTQKNLDELIHNFEQKLVNTQIRKILV